MMKVFNFGGIFAVGLKLPKDVNFSVLLSCCRLGSWDYLLEKSDFPSLNFWTVLLAIYSRSYPGMLPRNYLHLAI